MADGDADNELSPEEAEALARSIVDGLLGSIDVQDASCMALYTFYAKLQAAGFSEPRAYDMVKGWFLAMVSAKPDE